MLKKMFQEFGNFMMPDHFQADYIWIFIKPINCGQIMKLEKNIFLLLPTSPGALSQMK
jgi:hypothetical protein